MPFLILRTFRLRDSRRNHPKPCKPPPRVMRFAALSLNFSYLATSDYEKSPQVVSFLIHTCSSLRETAANRLFPHTSRIKIPLKKPETKVSGFSSFHIRSDLEINPTLHRSNADSTRCNRCNDRTQEKPHTLHRNPHRYH